MSVHHSTRTHSPFNTVLGKIGHKYQANYATYKTHSMTTCHSSAECPLDGSINLNAEDPEQTDTDNDSTHGSDAKLALGRPEAEGHPNGPIYSKQDKFMALMREINDLCQQVEVGEGQMGESLNCIECELQNLSIALHPPPPPTPSEPFGEVIHQYTITLCTTQKQTNLTNSLLQDIAVFNEYDSTKLEGWLTDIETAADLKSKRWTKLAKAKLRGLTHTLVKEAINSDKSWDEIKDLLWLKLCNANIHTYISCFMEIQQWEKESLAAYIQQFKKEAKKCNFMNDAATIRILIKRLQNAQSLATHIYEKGPKTLNDAILEVLQVTALIIPPSIINVMSHEEDHCFQCQKQGHIAQNCPHIRCHECNEYDHIVMDCPHRIPPSGTPVIHHKPSRSHHARSTSRHHHDERDRWSQSRSQSHFRKHHSLSHCESFRDHSRSQHWDRCSYHWSSSQQLHSTFRGHSHWSHHDTPHQPHHRSSTHSSSANQSRDTVDHTHDHPTDLQGRTHTDQVHIPAGQKETHTSRRTRGWKSKIHTWTITAPMITSVTPERNPIM